MSTARPHYTNTTAFSILVWPSTLDLLLVISSSSSNRVAVFLHHCSRQ